MDVASQEKIDREVKGMEMLSTKRNNLNIRKFAMEWEKGCSRFLGEH